MMENFETWLDAVWMELGKLREQTSEAGYYERTYAGGLAVYIDAETPHARWLVAWAAAPRGHQVNSGWQPFDPPWIGQHPRDAAERLSRALEVIEGDPIYLTFTSKLARRPDDA